MTTETTEKIIRLRAVTKSYRTSTVETLALRGLDLEVDAGDYIALTGPSGCGKTTLLNILALLDPVTEGNYWFAGQDVSQLTFNERAGLRNSAIGFVFQSFNLLDELSVLDNVKLPLSFARPARPERQASAQALLERVGLSHRCDHKPSQLSGGQQQRVALARALIMRPKLLLLDEPTGNLDANTSADIMNLLDELNDGNITLILVTHEPAFASRAKKILHLQDGRIIPA
jgi:putative ABC transport system ATP-binding protein